MDATISGLSGPDAGHADAGSDAGSMAPDAGSHVLDAGSDAGVDAGAFVPDAGSTVPDAGLPTPDAGSITCSESYCASWPLVFDDEFDGTGLVDATKWTYEVGFIRNNEAQYYTDARTENARQENGNLVIEAIAESYMGASYTSASVTTQNLFGFGYGRLEVRAKIPTGRGSWPAIWLLGNNIDSVGWPTCGEVDVMENVGFTPDTIYCTIHVADSSGNDQGFGGQRDFTAPTPFDDFHLYTMDFSTTQIVLAVDGNVVNTYANDGTHPWPFDQTLYLIINLAIGGSWGGQQGIDDSIFPLSYEIDYVRYFQSP